MINDKLDRQVTTVMVRDVQYQTSLTHEHLYTIEVGWPMTDSGCGVVRVSGDILFKWMFSWS